MYKWVEDIVEEGQVIRSAPRSFAIVTLTAIGHGWWGISSWLDSRYHATIEGKDAQIGILRDPLAAHQDKLQGATPNRQPTSSNG